MSRLKRIFSSAGQMLDPGEDIEVTLSTSRLDQRFRRRYAFITVLVVAVGVLLVPRVRQLIGVEVDPVLVSAGFVLPVFVLVLTEIHHLQRTYHFTDRKLIEERGILNKDFHTVPYQKITKIAVDQKVFDRLVNIGDIHINVLGTDEAGMVLSGVRNPKKIRSRISGYHDRAQGVPGQTEPRGTMESLSRKEVEAELGRVQRRKQELEKRYNEGEVDEEKYGEQWYILLGEEQLLERQLDMLEGKD